jgi:hypothetical protein
MEDAHFKQGAHALGKAMTLERNPVQRAADEIAGLRARLPKMANTRASRPEHLVLAECRLLAQTASSRRCSKSRQLVGVLLTSRRCEVGRVPRLPNMNTTRSPIAIVLGGILGRGAMGSFSRDACIALVVVAL